MCTGRRCSLTTLVDPPISFAEARTAPKGISLRQRDERDDARAQSESETALEGMSISVLFSPNAEKEHCSKQVLIRSPI